MADFLASQRVNIWDETLGLERGISATNPLFVDIVDTSIAVTAVDLDIRDLNQLQDNVRIYANTIKDGTGTALIPLVDVDGHLQVDVLSQPAETVGTKVHDYNTAAAVARNTSSNHDYTVTAGKTLKLKQVIVSASGNMKIEVQVGPVATLATKFVLFTSTSNPTGTIVLNLSIDVTGGNIVRLVRRNDSNKVQDVYSTIIGEEV